MSLVYRLMYLFGFTPWDTGTVPHELSSLVEGAGALRPGRALDIGCGTGTQSVYLASHGWQVTGVDDLEKPLRRARARSGATGVSVEWVRADATRLTESGITPGFDLVFDRGCFHGLNAQERAAYASGVTQLATPSATLLMMCFARNDVRVAPKGADEAEVAQAFADWELTASDPDSGPAPPGPLREVPRRWYRLVRR
jgi:cyclopropane fatty-acyl-phospholipid synthase-like methyltransferase